MENQAKKTMAAIEGVGKAHDKAAGGQAAAKLEQQGRAMRNVERAAKGAAGGNDSYSRSARNADSQTKSLTSSIVRLGTVLTSLRMIMRGLMFAGLAVAITTLVQAVGALAGGLFALLPALAAAGNALAALPAAAGAAVQGIATLKLAFGGVGDALKAGIQQQTQAGQAAEDMAEKQRSAANGVRQAERALFLANRSGRDAQQALTAARREAKRELIDMRFAAEGAVLGEKRAAISLRQARETLARGATDPGTSELDMASNQLSVREASLAYRQARTERQRAKADRTRSDSRGVGGSDRVVQARRALEDATYGQTEATRSLADAQRQANKAMTEGSAAANKYDEAMKQLSPEAQSFVKHLISMRPAVKDLKAAAGRELFPHLERSLSNATRLFPVLRKNLQATGGAVGRGAEGLSQDLTTPARLADVNTLMRHQTGLIDKLFGGLRNIISAFVDLAIAARPFTNWLADTVKGWTALWKVQAQVGRSTGSTAARLDRARAILERFGRIIRNSWIVLRELGRAAAPLGERLWNGAERATAGWGRFLRSAEGAEKARGWFDKLYAPLHELGQLTKDLAVAWAHITVDPNFTLTIVNLRKAVPHLERLLLSLSGLGPASAEMLTEIVRLLANIPISPITLLVQALTRLLRVINLLLETVPGLGTALGALLTVGLIAKVGSYLGKIKLVAGAWGKVRDAMMGTAAAQKLLGVPGGGGGVVTLPGGKKVLGPPRGPNSPGGKGKLAQWAGKVAPWAVGAGGTGLAGTLGLTSLGAAAAPFAIPAAAAGAAAYGGYKINRHGTDKQTGLRQSSYADKTMDKLGLGGLRDIGNSIDRRFGLGVDDATKRIEEFGNTAGQTFRDAKKWNDDASLRKLARQADELSRSGGKGAEALRDFARDARLAGTGIRDSRLLAGIRVNLSGATRITRGHVRNIVGQLRKMSPGARTAAAESITAMVQEMEANGEVAEGASLNLTNRLLRPLDGLAPRARAKVQRMIDEVTAALAGAGKSNKPGYGVFKPFKDLADLPTTRPRENRRVRGPASVRRLQRDLGVPADGVLGPRTRGAAKDQGIKIVEDAHKKVRATHRRTRQVVRDHANGSARDVDGAEKRKRRRVTADNNAISRTTGRTWKEVRENISRNAKGAESEASGAFDRLRSKAFTRLRSMGMSKAEASKLLTGNDTGKQHTNSGAPTDKRNAAYGKRMRYYAGGARIPGQGTHDTVPLGGLAAPGELIVNRHTEDRVKAKYGVDLGSEVKGENRPHSAPMKHLAGKGGGPAVGGGPNARAAMAPAGPGHAAHWMSVTPHAYGGRYAYGGRMKGGVGGNWGSSQKLIESFIPMAQKAGIATMGGKRGTRNTTSGGMSDHYIGNMNAYAIDFMTPSGGVDRAGETFAKGAAEALGFKTHIGAQSTSKGGYRVQMIWRSMTGGNHFNHIHLGAKGGGGEVWTAGSGGAGGLFGTDPMKALVAPRSKFKGVPGALAQRSMDVQAKAMTEMVNQRLGATGGGGGGTYTGPLDRRFKRMGGETLSFNQVASLAEQMGLPGVTFAQIAKGESGLKPGADGGLTGTPGPPGYGLWQMTPGAWGKGTAAMKKYEELGGMMAMFNPVTNAKMAKFLYDAAGKSTKPWYGTKYMTDPNAHYKGKMAYGGRMPGWGGWNARGGRFNVTGPTLFGAGESGAETVNITPKGKGGGGRGGAGGVTVHIGHIDYRREGDIQEAVKSELGSLAEDLELMGGEDD